MKVRIILSQDEMKYIVTKELAKRGYAVDSNCVRFGTTHLERPAPVYLGDDYESVVIVNIEETDAAPESKKTLIGCSERG